MSKLYIKYWETRTGGEKINPDETWSDYEDEFIEFGITSVSTARDPQHWLYHEVDSDITEGEWAFVVLVRYESGCTFGRTLGNHYIQGVYKMRDDAQAVRDSIQDGSYCKQGGYSYKPWEGYFERLESVDVQPYLVTP